MSRRVCIIQVTPCKARRNSPMRLPMLYSWYFAHSLKSLKQSLALTSIKPCHHTLIGSVETMGDSKRRQWLDSVRGVGAYGA